MISLRKLGRLKKETAKRKIIRILYATERDLREGSGALRAYSAHSKRQNVADRAYLRGLCDLAEELFALKPAEGDRFREYRKTLLEQGSALSAGAEKAAGAEWSTDAEGRTEAVVGFLRAINGLRHLLAAKIGKEAAEWDLFPRSSSVNTGDESGPEGKSVTLPMELYLEDIRSPFNLGSIFRSASFFGVRKIYLSPSCPSPKHPRATRSAMGSIDMVSWEVADLSILSDYDSVFALEQGGKSLDSFDFPSKGIVLIGSEELGLSPEALALADRKKTRVSIEGPGAKASLNVGVAVGILLSHWSLYALREA